MLAILKIHVALNILISNTLNKHSEDAGLEKANASKTSWVLKEMCWFPLSHWILSAPAKMRILFLVNNDQSVALTVPFLCKLPSKNEVKKDKKIITVLHSIQADNYGLISMQLEENSVLWSACLDCTLKHNFMSKGDKDWGSTN